VGLAHFEQPFSDNRWAQGGRREWQGLTLVHFSAQPKLCLTRTHTLYTPKQPLTTPKQPLHNPSTHPLYHKKRSC
jgi:hypothetical protein